MTFRLRPVDDPTPRRLPAAASASDVPPASGTPPWNATVPHTRLLDALSLLLPAGERFDGLASLRGRLIAGKAKRRGAGQAR